MAKSARQVSSSSESRMAAKSLLPLEDDEEDGDAGATNVCTSERESARHRVARGRESSAEAYGTEGCYAARRVRGGGALAVIIRTGKLS